MADSPSVLVTVGKLLLMIAVIKRMRIIEQTISGPAKRHNAQMSCGQLFCTIRKRPFIATAICALSADALTTH